MNLAQLRIIVLRKDFWSFLLKWKELVYLTSSTFCCGFLKFASLVLLRCVVKHYIVIKYQSVLFNVHLICVFNIFIFLSISLFSHMSLFNAFFSNILGIPKMSFSSTLGSWKHKNSGKLQHVCSLLENLYHNWLVSIWYRLLLKVIFKLIIILSRKNISFQLTIIWSKMEK